MKTVTLVLLSIAVLAASIWGALEYEKWRARLIARVVVEELMK